MNERARAFPFGGLWFILVSFCCWPEIVHPPDAFFKPRESWCLFGPLMINNPSLPRYSSRQ